MLNKEKDYICETIDEELDNERGRAGGYLYEIIDEEDLEVFEDRFTNGDIEYVKYLVAKYPSIEYSIFCTYFSYVEEAKDEDIKYFVSIGIDLEKEVDNSFRGEGKTILEMAAEFHWYDLINILVDNGVDINQPQSRGGFPLETAMYGHGVWDTEDEEKVSECIEQFVMHGCDRKIHASHYNEFKRIFPESEYINDFLNSCEILPDVPKNA
jgi:hypothetical protein